MSPASSPGSAALNSGWNGLGIERVHVEALTAHNRVRRLGQNRANQRRAKCREAVIAEDQPKRLLDARRIEGFGGEQLLQLRDRRGQLGVEALAPRSQRVPMGSAHQQLVAEQAAQSVQSSAHRRLAESNPLSRA